MYNMTIITILLLIFGIVKASNKHHDSIFMRGPLLNDVQMSGVFGGSKTFVDMKLTSDKDAVETAYKVIRAPYELFNKIPGCKKIAIFLNRFFDTPGSELEKIEPKDWKKYPKLINDIKTEKYKNLTIKLNNRWKKLTRKIKNDVKVNSDQYSMIYVPNPFIVQSEDYREFYYWDSYWIILGLLHSEMFTTVKGMLENFMYMVNIYGFVPSGNRIYYTDRSHPPLLIPMVKLYYEATKDNEFLRTTVHSMEKEFEFWLKKRLETLTFNETEIIKVARYYTNSGGPRPDSYRYDTYFASDCKNKGEFYKNIRSACESGWEFSSRWFIGNGENKGNVIHTETTKIIPVDLNAILCGNAKILSNFFEILELKNETLHYRQIHKDWVVAVNSLFWDDEEGFWFDYDTSSKKKRKYFYASNVAPLWTGCYDKADEKRIARKVVNYLTKKINVTSYEGGIPTSLNNTWEQWDFPNAIPPLVHMMIRGLALTKQNDAKKLAHKLAKIWVESNYRGYEASKAMFKWYNCTTPGVSGRDGEEEIQGGFGWTNGVFLDLLHLCGRKTKLNTAVKRNWGKSDSASVLLTKLHILPLLILCNYQMFY